MKAPTSKCFRAADRLGQHPVGHVADQHVLERQLALAGELALERRRDEDVLLLERDERLGPGRARPRSASGPSEPSQNVRPTTAACCTSRRSNGSSESRRAASTRLHGVGQLGGARCCPPRRSGGPSPRRTAGCRPTRSTTAAAPPRRRPAAARHQLAAPPSLSGSRNSCVAERRPPPQLGPPVEQLVARQADEHQRRAHPLRQVLDRVEHAVVGPVDVLEGDHERLPARPSPRCPQRSAEKNASRRRSGSSPVGTQLGRHLDAEQPADQRGLALGLLADRLALACRTGRPTYARSLPQASSAESVSTIAALLAQHLAERPEDDARCRRAGSGRCARSASDRLLAQSWRSNSRSRRDLPTPASPTTVTRCGARSRTTRS